MSGILTALITLLAPVPMKKDNEIPLYLRVLRWTAVALAIGFTAHCLKGWFF